MGEDFVYCWWRSDRGNFRKNNEDYVLVAPLGKRNGELCAKSGQVNLSSKAPGLLAVVCDGVGGENAGEVASQLTATRFFSALQTRVAGDEFSNSDSFADPEGHLIAAVNEANGALLDATARDPRLDGMASTLTGLWIVDRGAWLVNVGDSRIYRAQSGQMKQVSIDHTPVARLIREGSLNREGARKHPHRNVIEQAIGESWERLDPQIEYIPVSRGNHFLLCSDGLSDSLDDNVLTTLMVSGRVRPIEQAGKILIETALAHGGTDNVTTVILRVGRERKGFRHLLNSFLPRRLRLRSEKPLL